MVKLRPEDLAAPVLDTSTFLRVSLLGLFTIVLVRTAWMHDDAYITLRTVDNLVSGFGPRWNVSERVQAYTHPLWMFLLALPYSVTARVLYAAVLDLVAASMCLFVCD